MSEELITLSFKFLKFALVGLSGLAIDFALTFLCKEKLKINKYGANSIGFLMAASSNFVWNRTWTFGNNHPDISGQYARFIAVSLVGLILNTLILKLLHEKMKLNFYVAKLIAIGIVISWNFIANLFFTFK